jgi:hypothetical protein
MSQLRISIGTLMLVVTLAAANFGVLRAWPGEWSFALVVGFSPILNLMLIGLFLLLVRLVREGRSSSFWLGFVVFGFAGLFAYSVGRAATDQLLSFLWDATKHGLQRTLDWDIEASPNWPWLSLLVLMLFLSWPLVLLAVLGGCLTRKFGIMVVRRRSSETPPEGALA